MKKEELKENKTLLTIDYEKYRNLRKEGHSIYCAMDMALCNEKCKCIYNRNI